MQELKAKPRTQLGRKVKALRRGGFLPAVLYGEGVTARPISIAYADFERVYRKAGESSLLKLELEGQPFSVLIYDKKEDPLSGKFTHADFYAVSMDKEIKTKVSLQFIGESSAVKNEGGILVKVRQEVEVESLPQNLPHEIKIDLSGLSLIGSRFMVKDIAPPQGVKILADSEEVIVLVEAPRSEADLAALKVVAEIAPKAVETEQEVKKAVKAEKEKLEKTEENK